MRRARRARRELRARRAGRRRSWAAAAILAVLGCGRDARPPATDGSAAAGANAPPIADSVPAIQPSDVEAPVRYELDPAIAALESAVPRVIGNIDERHQSSNPRVSYAFLAERAPFDIAVHGNTVRVSSVVAYRARGWYKPPVGPAVGGSCGMSGDPPRVRITLTSTLTLKKDWTLDSHTEVPAVVPASGDERDRCKVTVLKHDVTDRVLDAVQHALEGKAALLDARVRKLDVHARVAKWWALLGRPIRVADGVWLELRPDSVRVGALRGGSEALVVPVGLTARPRIVTGARPDSSTAPLPDIAPGKPAGSGVHLLLEAALGYDDATRIVTRQLVGRTFERAGHTVIVQEARVFAARGGRLALTLRLGGDVGARVVLVGRPVYDHATGMLYVPDLDYAVGDASLLVRGADQVGHDALRDALRARARWPVTALVDSARARAERALNRDLTQGVHLGGKLATARALGVFAAPEALLVRADAAGQLSLDVNRAPKLGKALGRRHAGAAPITPAAPAGTTSHSSRGLPAPPNRILSAPAPPKTRRPAVP